MPNDLAIVEVEISESNEQLADHMRTMKKLREKGNVNIVLLVCGFDDDKRELFEIPEARAFCRRLVGIGFISFLDFATTFDGCDPDLNGGYGAAEVILCSEGRMKKNTQINLKDLDHFTAILHESNAKANALVGAPGTPDK